MNTQIYEEACEWFVDLRAGDVDAAGRRKFDAWVRQSPQHLRAYLEITEIWQDAPFVREGRDGHALIEAARAQDTVVDLGARRAVKTPTASMSKRYVRAASIALLGFVAAFAVWFGVNGVSTYSTNIGEQRTLNLADGSTVQLNARSRIRVRFTDTQRSIELSDGQALFRVARDPLRPFVVRSGMAQVRAVGTQFDIYRRPNDTTVTVVEGTVAVSTANKNPGAGALLLSAGEQVLLGSTARPPAPKKADVAVATAWTQNRLIFQGTPLSQVAEEFNRYNTRALVITDPQLAQFNISGVYCSTDPALLLRFLREQPGIRVQDEPARVLISPRE